MTANRRPVLITAALAAIVLGLGADWPTDGSEATGPRLAPGSPLRQDGPPSRLVLPDGPDPAGLIELSASKLGPSLQTVAIFGLASLAPAAALMATAFVRIQVVLSLLRQALGSPQVPGNQVITALSLLLTALVMRPQAEIVYRDAIRPLMEGRVAAAEAWEAGTQPLKWFMIEQIHRSGHEHYLYELYDREASAATTAALADNPAPGADAATDPPADCAQLPLRIVAPAFLLSELTTALVIGFAIYLPFLVIDLVVSTVLASMGLVMLPPSLVTPPLKLIVFVLAGGWWLVADMLLRSFGPVGV